MKFEDLAGKGFEQQKSNEKKMEELKEIAENANRELASATEDL